MITINGTAYDVRQGDQFVAKSNGHRVIVTAVEGGDVFFGYEDAPGTGAMNMVEKFFDYYRRINR